MSAHILKEVKLDLISKDWDYDSVDDITLKKLSNTITQMKKKASGDELLSVALLKSLFLVIGYPLLNFVNSSLRTAELPTDLKCSIIVPVPEVNAPKGGFQADQILEIIVYEHLIKC
ncbi:hypothetical protein HHI36_018143 [Cryptolaemus montrouzieri]|uniref:Uncharacterized protein n=1 Tax=Cryptolaemus montrouzieri TaxID=559131 RepID=A0ABD2NZ33_9CUCU